MSLVALRDAISSGPKALPRDALRIGDEAERRSEVLRLGGSIDGALPDGGLPRSAVVEVASPLGLAGATSLAVKACVGAQRGALHSHTLHSSALHSHALHAAESEAVEWCAWIDPWSTLHAPGLVERGVVLERLLVVRPPEDAIARCAVRIASSKAFALVIVDLVPPLGCASSGGAGVRLDRWPNVVRRLALAVEDAATTVLLLTDVTAHRALPLPVAMRVELTRDPAHGAQLRIAKDRHGRVGHGAASFVPIELASA
jgi:hypothetical protein